MRGWLGGEVAYAVEIEGAVVAYREGVALKGVSLRAREGELLGVFGPNGAGKTTLLRVINGLVRLESGKARVLGRELTPANLRGIRVETGYVPQAPAVDRRMPASAREVVLMGRYGRIGLLRPVGGEDAIACRAAMEQMGVWHLAERPFGHLSGGEQQRVMIARALAQEPRLLLLDEPTSSLDWSAQREIVELVREIHRQRRLTTVVVSHDARALPALCERIVLMQGGLIAGECSSDEFAAREMQALFSRAAPRA